MASIVAPQRAARLRSTGLALALVAGVVAALLVFVVEPISDFLGEGGIRLTGLEGGSRRALIGVLLLGSSAVMVAAVWLRSDVLGLAVAAVAALVALFAAGPFAMPAIVLAVAALVLGAAGMVERDRLDQYAPRRHPLPWAGGVIVGGVLLVVGAGISWYLIAPLLDEGTELDETLGFAVVQSTPGAAAPATPTAAAAAPTTEASAPSTPAASDGAGDAGVSGGTGMLISSGELMGADSFHTGSGQVLLIQAPDGSGLLRFEDYAVRNGPDLHVFLTPDAGGDVHVAGAIDLGEVRATRGNVNYELPADADLESMRVAVIYCVPFRVVFATAELAP